MRRTLAQAQPLFAYYFGFTPEQTAALTLRQVEDHTDFLLELSRQQQQQGI